MNVKEIVQDFLIINNYDGLAGENCGCFVYDLMPCGEDCSRCEPGYKTTGSEDSDWPGEDIITTSKPDLK